MLTDKEMEMVSAIDVKYKTLAETKYFKQDPVGLLSLVGMECFTNNLSGKAVDSLRRCIKHIKDGKYRYTDEYENLIDL